MSAPLRRIVGRPIAFRKGWALVAVWMMLIFVASSMSRLPDLPGGITDVRAHFLVYAVLGALLLRAMAGGGRVRGARLRSVGVATVLAALYGLTDEAHQAFVPGRVPSWTDLGADLAGGFVGAATIWGCGIVFSMMGSRRKSPSGLEGRR